jgi:hypothetical protein
MQHDANAVLHKDVRAAFHVLISVELKGHVVKPFVAPD